MPGRDLTVRYEGDTTGADAASAKTRAQLQQTADAAGQMAKQFETAAKRASSSGRGIGDGLVKSIAKAAGSTLLKSAGNAAGTALANAVGRQIAQTSVFKGLQAKAGIAGQQAGAKLSDGLERRASKINWSKLKTPALVTTAVGLGLLFGTRFGRSAEQRAATSFKPRFSLGGLTSGLKYAALGAGAAVGGVLAAAIAKGGARLDSIDTARGKLAGLGHDAKTVTTIMGDALAAVKGTAFGLDEAATVSASAVAAGIKPGKELQRTLKLVADTATIGNTSLSESGSIFNKVATSNKVYTDTLNQLGDRGIPIVQLLGDQMGKTSDEVYDLASKGKIDFKTFQDALEGGLGGAALKSGDTFQGALKNAKAALGRFGAGLLNGVFPQLKGVFGDVTKGLDNLTPTATRIGKRLGSVFADVVGLVKSLAPVAKSTGAIASAAFQPFVKSLGGGRGAVKGLTDFLSTHQEELTEFFVSGGRAAIGLGKAVVVIVAGILHAYAGLQKGVQATLDVILGTIQSTLGAAASASSALGLDGAAANLQKVADGVQGLRDKNKASNSGDVANALADSITGKLLPALDAAETGLDKVGVKEIGKAAQRDAANKTAQAIRDIGTGADGTQIKLKKFSDVSKLGSDAQNALRGRIKAAQGALEGQITAQQNAGAGQKTLNKTWESGRDKLAAEFRQMGLSKSEAGKLADKYAGIKPKVKTKFEAPGLSDTKTKAQQLKTALDNLPRDVQISVKAILSGADVAIDAAKKAFSSSGGVFAGPGRVIKAASGRVLPGYTPGRDIHRFFSTTGGELDLSGGEAIMRPEWTRAVGGPTAVARINREAAAGRLRSDEFSAGGVPTAVALPDAPRTSRPSARRTDSTLSRADVDRMVAAIEALEFGVEVAPDYRGFVGLIDARIAEASRKRKDR